MSVKKNKSMKSLRTPGYKKILNTSNEGNQTKENTNKETQDVTGKHSRQHWHVEEVKSMSSSDFLT